MKRLKLSMMLLFTFAGISVMTAQDREERDLRSFSRVWAKHGIDVIMKQGNTESAVVEVEDIDIDRVITEVEGSTLKIRLEGYNPRNDVKVYVTYKYIDAISASSAASIYCESVVKATDIGLSSSSAGDIEIEVEAEEVELEVSSSGEINIEGKTNYLRCDASSAGEIDAYDLESMEVKARASSAGSIKVNVTGEIDARASSGADIRYRGNPKRSNTDSSSGGSVKRVD